jgi:hypothetical protein
MQTISDGLSRLLVRSLRVPDVYCILCERGKVYVGQMGSATEMRRDEHVTLITE